MIWSLPVGSFSVGDLVMHSDDSECGIVLEIQKESLRSFITLIEKYRYSKQKQQPARTSGCINI